MSRRLIASCVVSFLLVPGIALAQDAWEVAPAPVEPLPPPRPQAPPPPAAAPAPAPPAKDPSAGHVWTPKVTPHAAAPAAATTTPSPAASETETDANAAPAAGTPASDPEPTTGPVTGFVMEARLAQSLGSGGASRGALGSALGAPPIASLGYRGDRFAVLFGPSFSHIDNGNGASATSVGLEFHFEITVASTDDRVNEGYLLLGASLGGTTPDADNASGGITGSLAAGFGARHWVSRHLAIGAEIGEGYLNVPVVDVTTSASGRITSTTTRAGGFDTFGALGVTVVF